MFSVRTIRFRPQLWWSRMNCRSKWEEPNWKKVDDSKIKYFFLLFGLQASAGVAIFHRKANVLMSENMKLNRETGNLPRRPDRCQFLLLKSTYDDMPSSQYGLTYFALNSLLVRLAEGGWKIFETFLWSLCPLPTQGGHSVLGWRIKASMVALSGRTNANTCHLVMDTPRIGLAWIQPAGLLYLK